MKYMLIMRVTDEALEASKDMPFEEIINAMGAYNEELGVKDVTWLAPDGEEMSVEQWEDPHNRCMGMLLDGRAQPTGIRRAGSDATLLIVINAHHDLVNFKMPEVPQGVFWNRLVDTNNPTARPERFNFGDEYATTGRSLLNSCYDPKQTRCRMSAGNDVSLMQTDGDRREARVTYLHKKTVFTDYVIA